MTAGGELAAARRVVVKIGSALLVDAERSVVRRTWLESLADDVARFKARGQEVLVVSSGAIALGRRQLGFASATLKLEEQQAAAAIGMIRLAYAYQESLDQRGVSVAQVLLTLDDTESRRRYINARNTLNTLLRQGAVPLINENDTVATDEIRFGDNDRLAARVAAMVTADALVLLSDTAGLYASDPRQAAGSRLIREVREITPEIEAMAGATRTGDGSGGMVTKIAAARIAIGAGCRMVIADGTHLHPLRHIEEGAACTWFLPSTSPRTARKEWIAGSLNPAGALVVDAGAVTALLKGKSLLPAGVVGVEGAFQRGAAVVVKSADGREVARGLAAYPADEARAIMGHKTGEIEGLLGYRGRDEIVHRDDLVLS